MKTREEILEKIEELNEKQNNLTEFNRAEYQILFYKIQAEIDLLFWVLEKSKK